MLWMRDIIALADATRSGEGILNSIVGEQKIVYGKRFSIFAALS